MVYDILEDLTSLLFPNTNADWVGCVDDRKHTSGGAFFLEPRLVAWSSKKKDSISFSIVEDEYISIDTCCTKVLWMKTN